MTRVTSDPPMLRPIDTLREALAAGSAAGRQIERPGTTGGDSYPIWRFLHAWGSAEPSDGLGPDLIVLLRQAVRWQPMPLAVERLHPSVESALAFYGETAGLWWRDGALHASPFSPTWIGGGGAAESGIDGAPIRRRLVENLPAEAYLGAFGFADWNSPAQKEGVWLAATAPPRSTTLIALPTGAGKSLCFQAAAYFGAGLTVVVVPTVALAIDHWRSAQRTFQDPEALGALYYAADDPQNAPDDVIEAVRQRRCRLLITSPEACVSGRLRPALTEATASGWLDTLVVDEAHLVDNWGMYFRVDFQVLAALRRQWLAAPGVRLRTLLLSATFTPECRRVLRRLFVTGDGGQWREFVSQRLRPEMTYFAHGFATASDREDAVLDCAWHLPRPAILYTTTRADARGWFRYLRERGFRRIGCFHGDTRAAERRALLDAWRADRLDVMIATSAFGMGVDKPDVRAVVHACFPEDLHRYYQEVGRGGRDGASAICVLMPALPRDDRIAENLAARLLKPETLQRRWSALWKTAEREGEDPYVWSIRTDARPPNLYGELTGRRNVAWNKRLLLQLARAGLLDLLDVRRPLQAVTPSAEVVVNDEEEEEEEDVPGIDPVEDAVADEAVMRLHFAPHTGEVGARIEDVRRRELDLMRAGLEFMRTYIRGEECVGRILRRLYGPETAYTCGGCPVCRRRGRQHPCPSLPIPAPSTSQADRVVVAGVPTPIRQEQTLLFQAFARRLVEAGVRRFLCASAALPAVRAALGRAFAARPMALYRVDALTASSRVTCQVEEAIGILHVGEVIEPALHLQVGRHILHLITTDTTYLDRHGRRPLELDGAPFYPSPELWAPEV